MSTYEPCQRPSTKETPIFLPMPRMQVRGQGAIESRHQRTPVCSLPLAQPDCRYRKNARALEPQFLDSMTVSPSHALVL